MSPAFETERLQILTMLEEGAISAVEAVRLLNVLTAETGEAPELGEDMPAVEEKPSAPGLDRLPADLIARRNAFRHWWRYPLAAGILVATLSGLGMAWGYQTAGYGFWFFCAWLPLSFGLAAIGFSLYSRTARWLHVRIHENHSGKPERTAFSFPLPIRPAAWFVRTFGRWIPQLDQTSLDELVLALEKNTSPDQPFYVDIQDDENEERVQVYIG